MAFEAVLVLHIAHAYGAVGLPRLRAAAAAEAWLHGHGMGVRPVGDRLLVYREVDTARRPRTPITGTATLGFSIQAASPGFAAVTDLTGLRAARAPLFTNVGAAPAERVDLVLTTRRARTWETLVPKGGGPARFLLGGRPDPSAGAGDVTATSPMGPVTVARFDAALREVELTGPGVVAGTPVALVYPVLPRPTQGAMAEVDIAIDQALIDARSAGRPIDCVISFAARSVRWCYYVVTAESVRADEVRITVPVAQARGLAFADLAARRDLTAEPDAGDAQGNALLAASPSRRVLRFLSDAPVPLRDQPIRGIELEVGGTRLFRQLPNPAPESSGALRRPDEMLETIHAIIPAASA